MKKICFAASAFMIIMPLFQRWEMASAPHCRHASAERPFMPLPRQPPEPRLPPPAAAIFHAIWYAVFRYAIWDILCALFSLICHYFAIFHCQRSAVGVIRYFIFFLCRFSLYYGRIYDERRYAEVFIIFIEERLNVEMLERKIKIYIFSSRGIFTLRYVIFIFEICHSDIFHMIYMPLFLPLSPNHAFLFRQRAIIIMRRSAAAFHCCRLFLSPLLLLLIFSSLFARRRRHAWLL